MGVLLASGGTAAISSLTVGTMVLASDTSAGESVAKPVQKVWMDHDIDLLDLTVTDDHGAEQFVHTTQHHPVAGIEYERVGRSWKSAGWRSAEERHRGGGHGGIEGCRPGRGGHHENLLKFR